LFIVLAAACVALSCCCCCRTMGEKVPAERKRVEAGELRRTLKGSEFMSSLSSIPFNIQGLEGGWLKADVSLRYNKSKSRSSLVSRRRVPPRQAPIFPDLPPLAAPLARATPSPA
jgi:hypothetical protein